MCVYGWEGWTIRQSFSTECICVCVGVCVSRCMCVCMGGGLDNLSELQRGVHLCMVCDVRA